VEVFINKFDKVALSTMCFSFIGKSKLLHLTLAKGLEDYTSKQSATSITLQV